MADEKKQENRQWVRDFFIDACKSEKTIKAIKGILENPDHDHFPKVLGMALDRGFGKVAEEHKLVGDEKMPIIVRFVRE